MNRYSYVLNNPIKLTDPTGHKCVGKEGECEGENGKKGHGFGIKTPKAKQNGTGGCGGNAAKNCDGTPTASISGVPTSITNQPAKDGASATTNVKTQFSGYDPDAIAWGFGFSGSTPNNYNVAGMEEIVLFENGKRAVFTYGGEGSSVGLGASGAAYGGLVFNLKDPDAYVGPFGSAGVTVSVLDVGVTASYFWDTSEAPLSPGITQGFAVGYAPGAQASLWWSSTAYSEIWRSDE